LGQRQIQTSVQAGGTASVLIRASVSRSRMTLPSGPMYAKPFPFRTRRIPGSLSDE
jgi:hypothetical protein